MKKTIKLIPAIVMLLVSAILVSTSTYAWFSMNSKVTVTGMTITTAVKDDLLIAPSTTGATALEADNAFKTALVQNVNALLEPVSTVDGVTYFYNNTKNTARSGDSILNSFTAYPADPSAANALDSFNANYGTTGAVGYVDYAFQLKATNTQKAAQNVNVTGLNFIYGGEENVQKAFRIAMFVNDMGEAGTTAATAPSSTSLKSIARVADAKYFGKTGDKADQAVSAVGDITAVNGKIDDAWTIGTVAGEKTNYYKVVVRVWLEGEDTTCNNTTFANLDDKWQLDLVIELQSSGDGVTAINQSATASKADLSSASLTTDTIVINEVTYTKVDTVKLNEKDLYVNTATITSASKVYTITDSLYPVDVTNQCTLPAPVTP